MRLWSRLRADLTRPDTPTDRDELGFHLAAPAAVVAIAQATDPAPAGTLLLLVPALAAFALRPRVARFPGELFAAIVLGSVTAAVGLDGDVEGVFFLNVIMVLYVAWTTGSLVRAGLVAAAAAATPWLVADVLVPEAGISWYPWGMAHLFVFVLGRTLHQQRSLIDQLEAARQALAAQAVADERRRIARELHDLAGHTLAAMVLHVTGARHVLRRDPAEAEAALQDAEAVGRNSLDQIRATVAALRTDERGTDPVLPGSADLPDLVAGYARAGLAIDAEIDAAPIDGPVGVALHRIAREALANVARHAPRNRVEIRVATTGDEVRLVVADRGAPAAAPAGAESRFGLIGMAERARAVGGELEAGPTPDGWRVAARLPLVAVRPGTVAR
ncbi:MAG TPA: histidine kinase [Acidimicrobiales bacterium]